jgi:hypothetical protein
MPRRFASSYSGWSFLIAALAMTRSHGAGSCSAAWPMRTAMPSASSASVAGLASRSLPETIAPRRFSICASPLIPEPPIPISHTRRPAKSGTSCSARLGPVLSNSVGMESVAAASPSLAAPRLTVRAPAAGT